MGFTSPPFPGAAMIRIECYNCLRPQLYPDADAGQEMTCHDCPATNTVGGPHAEHVPDNSATEPPSDFMPAGSRTNFAGRLLAVVACGLFLFALIGLPVLDFGFGYRIGQTRPNEYFWLVLPAAYGCYWIAEQFLGTASDGSRNGPAGGV